jgi:hypothetical protein
LDEKIILQQFKYIRPFTNFRKICHTTEKEKCLTQNAGTVERIVKYHSNQKKTDLFIAENVSKSINQNQEVGEDSEEDPKEDPAVMVEIEVLDLVKETIDHEKCLTQNAGTVEMIVKYHSNQKKTDLFIAENVSKITDRVYKLF